MKSYSKPIIDVLLFDEEDIITTSGNDGYTSAEHITAMMGDDADMGLGKSNVSISTVKVTSLTLE